MKTSPVSPRFTGIYQFKSSTSNDNDLLTAISSQQIRETLCLQMKERDHDRGFSPSALFPYKGRLLGVSGQDAVDLIKAFSDKFVNTLYSLAQRIPNNVLHAPVTRPVDEDKVTRFLEAKGKTLDTIDTIEV